MQLVFLFSAILMTAVAAMADVVRITSPDHAQTFAYGEMISHHLYLNRTAGELAARITFSNSPYADDNDPRRDECLGFRFPGAQFDSSRGMFLARSGYGELIPVARFRETTRCDWVDLAPGAKIYLVKESGRVTAILTATDYPRVGGRWVQIDNNFSLQNILIALFRDFRVQSDN